MLDRNWNFHLNPFEQINKCFCFFSGYRPLKVIKCSFGKRIERWVSWLVKSILLLFSLWLFMLSLSSSNSYSIIIIVVRRLVIVTRKLWKSFFLGFHRDRMSLETFYSFCRFFSKVIKRKFYYDAEWDRQPISLADERLFCQHLGFFIFVNTRENNNWTKVYSDAFLAHKP